MGPKKFYAVVKGKNPGIYDAWFGAGGAEIQVKGFAGAVYKGFPSYREAKEWFDPKSRETAGSGRTLPLFPAEAKTPPKKPAQRRGRESGKPAGQQVQSGTAVIMYSDGGCKGNPGPGGYGVVIQEEGTRRELSGGYALTTNNRMELTGCIKGLESLGKRCSVVIHTDSQYVVKGIEQGWAKRWKKNNWMRNARERAENSDLWSRLLELCEHFDVTFVWVRGHSGDRENERCDRLAVEMTCRGDLPPDTGFSG